MNRRRKQPPKISSAVLFGVILAAVIVAAGGVFYVLLKNRQIQVTREMDAVEKNIEHCHLEIRTMEMRMDQLLNRFVIRKKLEENGSRLQPTPVAMVEEVELEPLPPERSVALHPPNP